MSAHKSDVEEGGKCRLLCVVSARLHLPFGPFSSQLATVSSLASSVEGKRVNDLSQNSCQLGSCRVARGPSRVVEVEAAEAERLVERRRAGQHCGRRDRLEKKKRKLRRGKEIQKKRNSPRNGDGGKGALWLALEVKHSRWR